MPRGQKMTTDSFIQLAKETHGDRYDYSKTCFLGSRQKLSISCLLHGMFTQLSTNHLAGRGCPDCGKEQSAASQTVSTEDWIVKAKEVHGDKYDYSDTVYVHCLQDVRIWCSVHGFFVQQASNHLRGSGCQQCGWQVDRVASGPREVVTTEIWAARARTVHGNLYDYAKSVYVNSSTKIIIVCKIHGEFEMMPSNHVSNASGCIQCGRLSAAELRSHTLEWFEGEAKKVHEVMKYDYSHGMYVNMDTPIEIRCPLHGTFVQAPYNHLNGQKCPGCANRVRYNTETYITAAIKVHGQRYDYSKLQYITAHEPVQISCALHGIFEQKAYCHLAGKGCGRCGQCANSSKASNPMAGIYGSEAW